MVKPWSDELKTAFQELRRDAIFSPVPFFRGASSRRGIHRPSVGRYHITRAFRPGFRESQVMAVRRDLAALGMVPDTGSCVTSNQQLHL